MEPEVPYRTHECPPPVPILSQLHPVPTTPSNFLKIHLNIILPSMSWSPQWPLSLMLPQQHPVHPSILLHTRHIRDEITERGGRWAKSLDQETREWQDFRKYCMLRSFIMNITFAKYYWDDQITEHEMGRTCSAQVTEEKQLENFVRKNLMGWVYLLE